MSAHERTASGQAPDIFVLRPGPADVPGGGPVPVLARLGHEQPVLALARALASSPPARTLSGVTVAARESPTPLIVFLGVVDEAGRARLAELPGWLEEAGHRLRPLGWGEVERAVGDLAVELERRLDRDFLHACALVGIPRGGLVVAGLLAYALGIPRHRVGPPTADDHAPILLVDDCALSGVRLRRELAHRAANRTVAVATLCSHPELRARVEREEERVVAFVSGLDLRDHGEAILGSALKQWRTTWTRRVPSRYHTALLDLLAFPWSEPEIRLWNPVTRGVEPGWQAMPPIRPRSHRGGGDVEGLRVQVADRRTGIERLAPPVVPLDIGHSTVLVDADAGRATRLYGSARLMWTAWMEAGPDAAVKALTRVYGLDRSRASADLDRLLERMAARGLLAPEPPGHTRSCS